MIVLGIGKKGSGKTAALRKIAWRVSQSHGSRALVFFHDPHAQIAGPVYSSVGAWRGAATVPPLSVFRGVEVEELAQLAKQVGDVTLVLDELDLVSESGKRWSAAPTVRELVHYGRHLRVNVFGGFRRTANVPEDILSQADKVLLFAHELGAVYDVRTVRDRFGQEYADAVVVLEPGQFVVKA